MKIINIILAIVVSMAFMASLAIMVTRKRGEEEALVSFNNDFVVSSKEARSAVLTERVSRFLAQEDPRQKFHCNKDNVVCRAERSPGSTCCNNKCIDIRTDNKNCGDCKNKCKYTETCCNGQSVNVNFDKRHCGKCGNKCMQGGYCIYGTCDYA